jgi:hypothetical protein
MMKAIPRANPMETAYATSVQICFAVYVSMCKHYQITRPIQVSESPRGNGGNEKGGLRPLSH